MDWTPAVGEKEWKTEELEGRLGEQRSQRIYNYVGLAGVKQKQQQQNVQGSEDPRKLVSYFHD